MFEIRRPLSLIAFLALSLSCLQAQDADFTLTLDQSTNPLANYSNYHKAGAGTGNQVTGGFQIDVTSISNTPITFSNSFAAFCIEIQEPIGLSSYTHTIVPVEEVSGGRAGEAGTASSNIPVGGIGALRAARVRALFDSFYVSPTLSDWSHTVQEPKSQAFQLALWEVSHDDDLSLSQTSGSIYIGAQSRNTQRNGVALAQTYLDSISKVTASYTSTVYDVWSLENIGVPEGNQDVIFATAIGSGDSDTIYSLIPEPSTSLLAILGGAFALLPRRR